MSADLIRVTKGSDGSITWAGSPRWGGESQPCRWGGSLAGADPSPARPRGYADSPAGRSGVGPWSADMAVTQAELRRYLLDQQAEHARRCPSPAADAWFCAAVRSI